VELQTVADPEEQQWLRERIELHQKRTGSLQAARILAHWSEKLPQFIKVMPLDYKRVLEQRRQTMALDSAVEAKKPMASAAAGKDEKRHG